MSAAFAVNLRDRWSARSMVLAKWLTDGSYIKPDTPICELNIDDRLEVVRLFRLQPADEAAAIAAYVREGQEVGPSGMILEYSTNFSNGKSPRENLRTIARSTLRRRPSYPEIFINYRQADTEAYAWRLHETLTQRYGRGSVFLDQFSIRPGEPWRWTLQQAVVHCRVMISLIGPQWMPAVEPGRVRLENSYDLVVREMCAALDRGIIVMPVLTPRGEIPPFQKLPEDLAGLDELQYLSLSSRHWESDLRVMLEAIDEHVKPVGGSRVHGVID